jgi:hypothetical protein
MGSKVNEARALMNTYHRGKKTENVKAAQYIKHFKPSGYYKCHPL